MPAPGPFQPDTEGHRPGSVTLPLHTWRHSLSDPSSESTNFPDEAPQRYPDAISFAIGRPYEELFDIAKVHRHLEGFCRYLEADRGRRRPARLREALTAMVGAPDHPLPALTRLPEPGFPTGAPGTTAPSGNGAWGGAG